MGPDWEVATVADLEARGLLLVQDGNHGAYRPRPHEIVENGVPHIRAADIADDGRIDVAGAQRVADSAWERIKKGRSRGGDVLLTHKGTVGRIAVVPGRLERVLCSPQTTFWRSLDTEVIDQRFIAAYLRSDVFQAQLRRVMHETDMAPYVSLTNQRALLVSVPPVVEQRAIADVLGALDDKIESNKRVEELLRDLVRVSHLHAVAGAVTWEPLAELGTVSGGGTPRSKVPEYWEPAEVPWVTPRDLTALEGCPVIWAGERSISHAGLTGSSARLLEEGTVLYTSRATLGLVAIAQQPLATNQGFISVTAAPQFSSAFVYATLLARTQEINAKANGSTFQEVNKTNFKSVEFARPGDDALRDFDAVAGSALLHVAGLVRETRALSTIRYLLLPRLVSGQIRVPLSADNEEQVGAAVEAVG